MMHLASFLSRRESFLHLKGKREPNCYKNKAPQLVEADQVVQVLGQAAWEETDRFTSEPSQKFDVLKYYFPLSLIAS